MPATLPSDAARKRGAAPGVEGRELGRVVRRYLGALETEKSARGRKRGLEAIQNRLLKIDELLVTADPLSRLHLTQERIDLHAEVVRVANGTDADFAALEADFVQAAKAYGDVTGITYAAWRQVGVDADVLDRAGIARAATNHKPEGSKNRPEKVDKAGTTDKPEKPETAAKAESADTAAKVDKPDSAASRAADAAPATSDASGAPKAAPAETPVKSAPARPAAKAKKARKAAAPKGDAAPNPNSASMRRKRMAAGSEAASS